MQVRQVGCIIVLLVRFQSKKRYVAEVNLSPFEGYYHQDLIHLPFVTDYN